MKYFIIIALFFSNFVFSKSPNLDLEQLKLQADTDMHAKYLLASIYYKGDLIERDLKKAANLWKEAAIMGHAQSKSNLGTMYQSGLGLDKDLIKAIHWYKQAKNHAPAQHNLGTIYATRGPHYDLKLAHQHWEKAAKQNYAPSQYVLGILYAEHKDFKNFDKALFWHKEAAKQNYAPSEKYIKNYLQDKKFIKNEWIIKKH